MSYGWLTESALIPKPSKPINVDNTSLIDLKVMLEKEKGKDKKAIKLSKTKTKIMDKTNKGIELRNQKDLEAMPSTALDVQAKLAEKSKIYESMMKGEKDKKGEYLVDFGRKKFENMTEEEAAEYEKEREAFYKEKEIIAKEKEAAIVFRNASGELARNIERVEAERLKWEEEALREIEEGITEEMKEQKKTKVLVKQSYDRVTTESEKELLREVIKEEEEEKNLANQIKRKRQEKLHLRQEKIRKLNEPQMSENKPSESKEDSTNL